MGIYLNPDNENFTQIARRKTYVDKTMMIAKINEIMDEKNKYVCMSRPRRFGKTIAGNMLAAYYSKGCDSTELFSKFKIAGDASFKEKLNKYNVIKIDMNSEYQNMADKSELIRRINREIKKEVIEEFSNVGILEEDTLAQAILRVYAKKKEKFVIIIDEYDILVRENFEAELFNEYLGFLNGLFKSDTLSSAIALAYITGILPVVRDKVQSKLNNFDEYTILDAGELSEFFGFTRDEVRNLCMEYDMDFEECKRWYDGYDLDGCEIYNPESVITSMTKKRFGNYWSRTSSYAAIADRIRENFEGMREDVIRMLSGESVKVNVTRFMNTMDSFVTKSDVFTYLTYLGYLAFNIDDGTCYIPNREVRQEWLNAVEGDKNYKVTDNIIKKSENLLGKTIAGDEEAVAKALDISHIHVTSNRSYNNEDALQSAIYLAYIYALNEYTVFREVTAGKGFADVIYIPFVPDKPAMIIELKKDKTAESAIEQIKNKEYFAELEHYHGNLLFVGINYDEDRKTHSCKIEKFLK
ncbi:AAA family ATPase [Lachnospiraceae bacterium C1.1]|nr:AAA family ATPase [Lachnospiraceae bacterium C1.1]